MHFIFRMAFILSHTLECIIDIYVIALRACVRVWVYALLFFMLRSLS